MMEHYSRNEIFGYLIIAAKELKLDKKVISNLIEEMDDSMNTYTEVYAEKQYDEFFLRSVI